MTPLAIITGGCSLGILTEGGRMSPGGGGCPLGILTVGVLFPLAILTC